MTVEREACFENQYYVNIRRLLTIVGLWPNLESSKRLSYLVGIMAASFSTLQIYLMVISDHKVEPIIELLQIFLPTFLFTYSYWYHLYNSALMKETLERFKNDWNELSCDHELSIMHTYGAQGKLYSQLIACFFFLYIVFLIFPSILYLFLYICGMVQLKELIVPVHHEIFVATKSVYFVTFSFELVMSFLGCLIGIATYSTFITLVQHACALLMFVTNEIDRPFIVNEYKFCWGHTGSKCEAELEWIVAIVQNYKKAITFVELLTSVYEKVYIVEVFSAFCFMIINFIYFFQFLNMMLSTVETLKFCFYLIGSLLVIYGYFHLGERLMEHSTSVHRKCRLVPFYTLSVQTNKLFLLLIIRSMKPCNISIKGTAVASHELFAKIMKVSFSFATICYNVH